MQGLLTGIVLACVTGLWLLAYRHPPAYARLYPYLNAGACVVFVMLAAWQLAIEYTWDVLKPLIATESLADAKLAIRANSLPLLPISASFIGAMLFFWISLKLPGFLARSDKSESKSQ